MQHLRDGSWRSLPRDAMGWERTPGQSSRIQIDQPSPVLRIQVTQAMPAFTFTVLTGAKLLQMSSFILVVIGADASFLPRPVRGVLLLLALVAAVLVMMIDHQAH
ncbi:MAG: hypothetical protein AAGC69_10355 [Paracraurococcus sp.]|jgi:hypothetical protein